MLFSSLPFLLCFLPFVLAGAVLFAGWIEYWLIFCSLLFYGIGAPNGLPVLVFSVLGNFLLLKAAHASRYAGRLITVGILLNLGLLSVFKLGLVQAAPPLGISFFTFTQIGCLLYHAGGDTAPPKLRHYTLFAAFFPSLLAGPILSAREMLPQLHAGRRWRLDPADVAVGIGFFVIGLLKKTLAADPLAPIVDSGFASAGTLGLLPAWQVALSYSLQLYFDFSGYTDMAIGLARMFGLLYPDNFDQPYRARCVIDYWQRWHISLTRFVMTFVHAPLTLSVLRWRRRQGWRIDMAAQKTAGGFVGMIALPVGCTMALVAVWHGVNLTFLVFGLLHTAFLLINHAWRLFRGRVLPPLLAAALTYLCVLTGSVVFRATSIPEALSVLAGMAGRHGFGFKPPDGRALIEVFRLVALYGIVWFAPTTRQIMQGRPSRTYAWRPSTPWAVLTGCAATLGLLAAGGTGEFLYFRF